MTKAKNDRSRSLAKWVPSGKRFAKLLIALAVAFGLWRTVVSAREQLAHQQEVIRGQLVILDQKIGDPSISVVERESLMLQRSRLIDQEPNLYRIQWHLVVLASLIYAVSLVCPALFFHQILRHMGQDPRPWDSVYAHLLGHLGKYVPGKALVVVLRTSAISGPKVRTAVASVAVFVETLVMMAAGGTVAGILVSMLQMPRWIIVLAIGLVACTALPTLPPIFNRLLGLVSKARTIADAGLSSALVDWRLMICGWGWMCLLWFGIGLSFSLIILATPGVTTQEFGVRGFALSTAAISLAMVAGFVSLLPGGAGVRELVISTVLATRFGLVPALVAAILARVVFLAVEVMLGGWIQMRMKRVRVP